MPVSYILPQVKSLTKNREKFNQNTLDKTDIFDTLQSAQVRAERVFVNRTIEQNHLAWDWPDQEVEVENEWFPSRSPETYLIKKELWFRVLQAMRGVKFSQLAWLHYYVGFETTELAQMYERSVLSIEESIALSMQTVKFKLTGKGSIPVGFAEDT